MKKVSIDDLQHFAFNVPSDEVMKEVSSGCFVVAANLALPTPNLAGRRYEAVAIWDTGATHSCVSYKVVETLNLEPVSATAVATASNEETTDALVYLVDIGITDLKVGHARVGVLGMKMKDDVLIGMDIIGRGDFAISGGRLFSYCFPPCPNPVDLVAKADRVNRRKHRMSGHHRQKD